jgi:predicted PurR-regulated permease PerM
LLPRDHVDEIRQLARDVDKAIAAFVRGQGLVSLIMAAFYSAGLVLVGLNFGFLIGLVAGLLGFIPFVGALIGFVVSLGVALAQFWPDWIMIAATLSVFVFGQMLENYFLQPRLIGGNVGLHPVWIMFALLAFG